MKLGSKTTCFSFAVFNFFGEFFRNHHFKHIDYNTGYLHIQQWQTDAVQRDMLLSPPEPLTLAPAGTLGPSPPSLATF